jgi:hypothetical protein
MSTSSCRSRGSPCRSGAAACRPPRGRRAAWRRAAQRRAAVRWLRSAAQAARARLRMRRPAAPPRAPRPATRMTTPALRTSARSCPARTRRPAQQSVSTRCGAKRASARASGCDASTAGACSAAVTAAALALSSAACAAASACEAAAPCSNECVACCVPMRCATHRSRAVHDGRGCALRRLQRAAVRGGRKRLRRGRYCKRLSERFCQEAAAPRGVRRQLHRAEGDEQFSAAGRVRAARAQRQHRTEHRGGRLRRRRWHRCRRRTLRKQLPPLMQCMRHDARSGRRRGAQLAAQQQRREHGACGRHPGSAQRAPACASVRQPRTAAAVPGKRSGGGLDDAASGRHETTVRMVVHRGARAPRHHHLDSAALGAAHSCAIAGSACRAATDGGRGAPCVAAHRVAAAFAHGDRRRAGRRLASRGHHARVRLPGRRGGWRAGCDEHRHSAWAVASGDTQRGHRLADAGAVAVPAERGRAAGERRHAGADAGARCCRAPGLSRVGAAVLLLA